MQTLTHGVAMERGGVEALKMTTLRKTVRRRNENLAISGWIDYLTP